MGYQSQYYDPEKAKEYNKWYYETHKKLKGRRNTSTAGLNDAGKYAANVTRYQINKETQEKSKEIDDKYAGEIQTVRDYISGEVSKLTEQLKQDIANLGSMSKEARKEKVAQMREAVAEKRKELQEKAKEMIAKLRESQKGEKETLKETQNNKYADELDKIRDDDNMIIKESAALLNEQGKRAAQEAKQNIAEELQRRIQQETEDAMKRIQKIQEQLKKKTVSYKEAKKWIEEIAKDNAATKQKLQKEFDEKYMRQLERIRKSHKVSSYIEDDE